MMTARDDSTSPTTWVAIDVAKRWNMVLVEGPEGRHRFRVANNRSDHDRLVRFLHAGKFFGAPNRHGEDDIFGMEGVSRGRDLVFAVRIAYICCRAQYDSVLEWLNHPLFLKAKRVHFRNRRKQV